MNTYLVSERLRFTALLALLFLGSGVCNAQTSFPVVKEFFAPPYPPAARALNASGDVRVLIDVDEDGKVLTSAAQSGHPLLRASAEAIAKRWKFSSVPGMHFLVLTFEYRLPKRGDKDFARLRGQYVLEFTAKFVRIIYTPSYGRSASHDE